MVNEKLNGTDCCKFCLRIRDADLELSGKGLVRVSERVLPQLMTSNQLAYQRNLETSRANKAQEALTAERNAQQKRQIDWAIQTDALDRITGNINSFVDTIRSAMRGVGAAPIFELLRGVSASSGPRGTSVGVQFQ